jgi:phage repressor protein C with HTH and peptisase S24 domain
LQDFLNEKKWKAADLSRVSEVAPNTLSEVLKGYYDPSSQHLDRIIRTTDINPIYLFSGEGPVTLKDRILDEFTSVPKKNAPLSGGDGIWEDVHETELYYAFRTKWLKKKGQPKHMTLWEVRGDSMSPLILDGDFVLVDESMRSHSDGMITALTGSNNEFLVKRIKIYVDGKIGLVSDKDQSIDGPYNPDQLTIIGKVIWIGREL